MADTRREQGARVDDEPRLRRHGLRRFGESSSNDFGEDPEDVRAQTLTTVEEMRDAAPGARIIGLSTIWNDETDLAQTVLGKLSDAGVPG